jgi:predicted ribosome quality control (RQC) complex YloA/Tae2 family protein
VLPVEINMKNSRVSRQDDLSAIEYNELMMEKVDETPESRFKALKEIEKEKRKVPKAYKKKVKKKHFKWEIWCGKQFYRWVLRTAGLGSGHPVGRDHTGLSK